MQFIAKAVPAGDFDAFFGIMSAIIAVPTGVKVFNWLFMFRGRLVFTTPMLWLVGFMVTLGRSSAGIGTLTVSPLVGIADDELAGLDRLFFARSTRVAVVKFAVVSARCCSPNP